MLSLALVVPIRSSASRWRGPDPAETRTSGPHRTTGRAILFGAWLVLNVAVIVVVSGGGYAFAPIDTPVAEVTEAPHSSSAWTPEDAESGPYVVVDRNNNQLFVRHGSEILVEAVVSTGSGDVLRETSGQRRSWTFDTPSGRHRVLSKRRDPVWVKPDWAFIEAGVAVPVNDAERTETEALGAYALDLGDGYMIHGATYERLLGRSTTHGCIRAGREDLQKIFDLVPVGASVYVFPAAETDSNEAFTLVMDLERQDLTLHHGGTVLRTYRFSSVERGELRLPIMRGGLLDGAVQRMWSHASIEPQPRRPRREILQDEVAGAPNPAGAVAYIPLPPDSITPVPSAFRVVFEDGLTLVVESEGTDEGVSIAERFGAVASHLEAFAVKALPNRGERARLRVRMSALEAGALYRSLPSGSRLVVTRSQPDHTPSEQLVLSGS